MDGTVTEEDLAKVFSAEHTSVNVLSADSSRNGSTRGESCGESSL